MRSSEFFFSCTSGEIRTTLPVSRWDSTPLSSIEIAIKIKLQRRNYRGGSRAGWAVCCRSRGINLVCCSSPSGHLPFSWHCKHSEEVLTQRKSLRGCQFAKLKELSGFKFLKQNCYDSCFHFCLFCLIIVQSQKYFSSLQSWKLTRLSKWTSAHWGMERNMLFFLRMLLIVLYCLPAY